MSLFTRVIGLNEDEPRIAIHLIQSCMSEINASRMSVSSAIGVLGLDSLESDDFVNVLQKAVQSSDPQRFSSRVFNFLVLGESAGRAGSKLDYYIVEENFWLMIDAESQL